jgi:glycosyltransferase involved in cell wall biosynthesis
MEDIKVKTLSFIIPLYNSAQWLQKCLYSVLNQDIPESEMEIICINDGSPDNSADIAREIAEEHPCIIVIDQENQGPSGARNNGMRHATGKYLCFVDPDDFVEPNVYGGLIKQIEEQQLDMLRFNYQIVNEHYEVIPKRPFELKFDYTPQLMTGTQFLAERLDIACNIWRYIYRTEIIIKNNIWCYTGDYYDDTPWLPLVLMKAERMNICNTVVYDYLERSDSLVNSKSPRAVQRKIDGGLMLLEILTEQLKAITDVGVRSWYDRMISHSVVSLMTLIGAYQYDKRKEYIQQLNRWHIFPLMKYSGNKQSTKVRLLNFSPRLFLWLLHIKNKQ